MERDNVGIRSGKLGYGIVVAVVCSGCLAGRVEGGDPGGGGDGQADAGMPADGAAAGTPDAAPGTPDALASVPDAVPAVPDAMPAVPDAAAPDTFCQGGDVVLREKLVGSSGGTVHGGSFIAEGWQTTATNSQIYWDLGQVLSSGSIEFQARGFHANVGGCLAGVCYYVGIFEESNGDKGTTYHGSPFIESRFHTNDQENYHDTFKIQAGAGDGSMQEPMIQPGIGWAASSWHQYRIEWGNGQSRLFIDGNRELTANYPNGNAIQWRHLFLGTTNYKGLSWAATGITFRELCVRSGG